jgi:hypothetical protein
MQSMPTVVGAAAMSKLLFALLLFVWMAADTVYLASLLLVLVLS